MTSRVAAVAWRCRSRLASLLALVCCVASASALAEERYRLDAAHSLPTFEFTHLGLSTQTGRFDRISGDVRLDREKRRGSIHVEIETASLDMGFGTEQPDSAGYRFLQVDRFPRIVFDADDLYFSDSGAVVAARGRLTFFGATRPQNVWVRRFRCGPHPVLHVAACSAEITAIVRRSDFGLIEYLPAISDEIHITVPIEAIRE